MAYAADEMSEAQVAPEMEFPCPEPGCDGTLRRKVTKNGFRYLCDRWPRTRCTGALGCHDDGRPIGVPGDRATREARVRAHRAFDQLWKSRLMSRTQAYRWLALRLGVQEAHIGSLTMEQCETVIRMVESTPKPNGLMGG